MPVFSARTDRYTFREEPELGIELNQGRRKMTWASRHTSSNGAVFFAYREVSPAQGYHYTELKIFANRLLSTVNEQLNALPLEDTPIPKTWETIAGGRGVSSGASRARRRASQLCTAVYQQSRTLGGD